MLLSQQLLTLILLLWLLLNLTAAWFWCSLHGHASAHPTTLLSPLTRPLEPWAPSLTVILILQLILNWYWIPGLSMSFFIKKLRARRKRKKKKTQERTTAAKYPLIFPNNFTCFYNAHQGGLSKQNALCSCHHETVPTVVLCNIRRSFLQPDKINSYTAATRVLEILQFIIISFLFFVQEKWFSLHHNLQQLISYFQTTDIRRHFHSLLLSTLCLSTGLRTKMSKPPTKSRYAKGKSTAPQRKTPQTPQRKITSHSLHTGALSTGDIFFQPPPPPDLQQDTLQSPAPIAPACLPGSVFTALRELSRTDTPDYKRAKALLLMRVPIPESAGTIDVLRPFVGRLLKAGYTIAKEPFLDANSPLNVRLRRYRKESAKMQCDLFSTQNTGGIIVDLEETGQRVGVYDKQDIGITSHLLVDMQTGAEDDGTHFIKKFTKIVAVPIYARRDASMTMEATATTGDGEKWGPLLNLVLYRKEIAEQASSIIDMLHLWIDSGLTEQQQRSLYPRIIMTSAIHSFSGPDATVAKCDNHCSPGILIYTRLDPSNKEHIDIERQLLTTLMGDAHTHSREVNLLGFPGVLIRHTEGQPDKMVHTKYIPEHLMKLTNQYWLTIHGLPIEYTPHHLHVFLIWTLGVTGIRNIFQELKAFNSTTTYLPERELPTMTVTFDSMDEMQALMASKAVFIEAVQYEQLTAYPPADARMGTQDEVSDDSSLSSENSQDNQHDLNSSQPLHTNPSQQPWEPARLAFVSVNCNRTSKFPKAPPNHRPSLTLCSTSRSTMRELKRSARFPLPTQQQLDEENSKRLRDEQQAAQDAAPPRREELLRALDTIGQHLNLAGDEADYAANATLFQLEYATSTSTAIGHMLGFIDNRFPADNRTVQTRQAIHKWATIFCGPDFQAVDDSEKEASMDN